MQLSRDPLDHHAPFGTFFGPWLAAIRNEEKSQRGPALQDTHCEAATAGIRPTVGMVFHRIGCASLLNCERHISSGMEDHPHDRNPKDLEYDCRLCAYAQQRGSTPRNMTRIVVSQSLAKLWQVDTEEPLPPVVTSHGSAAKQKSKNASLVALSNQDTRCWNSLPEGCKAANPFQRIESSSCSSEKS